MAEYLASIFGTEKDKVNCSFYFKIGACRHGDRCSRLHNKPTFSQGPPYRPVFFLSDLYRFLPQPSGSSPRNLATPPYVQTTPLGYPSLLDTLSSGSLRGKRC